MELPISPVARPHRNHGLFSDHYLNVTLPERPDWRALEGEAERAMADVARALDAFTPSANEAQTEEDLVRPVLRILGHDFEVQPALLTPEGTKRPDYVLYRDAASRDANKDRALTDELLRGGAFAVGDAKFWERPLDVSLKGRNRDAFSNKNPSYQISFYMQHAGTEWGVLTNGRLWRLYHRDTAHKLDRFYEVDLPVLVESGDAGAFLYFFAFFRRAAFEDQALGVGALLRESEDYARSVGDSLKGQVYEALRHLAQGFLDYPGNGLDADEATLREIYDNSLIVLYRLLFVLYAESRDLLPLRESAMYRDTYSLHAIKHDIAEGRALLPTSATLWPRLKELFGIINEGSPPLKVATFDGGLFDPERHPFLESHTVGDGHLREAVDRLARVDGQFVDYRDLAERHLGTIYEGLLEYHLEALDEPDEAEPDWTVSLLNDRGERKATGSYYTPDYVVKYIVEATVGPVLRETVEGAKTDEEKVAAVLSLNVLDPSMGSGHFLVEVTEHIARFLVELGATPEGEEADEETELAYWKRRVAQSCVYGVDMNPLAVDLAKLSLWLATVARDRPLSFLDHHLRTGNSLVGARISELQPGGGKRKKAKQKTDSGQLSMLEDDAFRRSMSTAVGSIWLIEESPADTVEEVKEQERLYARLREDLTRRYARLADLATATYFGVEVDRSLWKPLADYATKTNIATLPQFQHWLDEAAALSEERRFFHWELEFPEVFFDRQGRPLGDDAGFDAVVGNPPYVRQEALGSIKPYFREAYPETYHGVADLYVYFYQQGLRQLRRGGRLGYISSGMFRRLNYGAPLRGYLTSQSTPVGMVEFDEQQIFSGAVTYPVVLFIENRPAESEITVQLRSFDEVAGTPADAHKAILRAGTNPWVLVSPELEHVLYGWDGSKPLGEVLDRPIYRGVTTGLNEAFVIDQLTRDRLVREDPSSADIIKPFLRGEDLRPWYQKDEGLWLILLPSGWTQDTLGANLREEEAWSRFQSRHHALAAYLSRFSDAARKRSDQGDYWWELRPCSYYSAFKNPRVHSTKVSLFPTFSFLEQPAYAANTSYVMPIIDHTVGYYLISILNSHVCEYCQCLEYCGFGFPTASRASIAR